MFSSTQKKFYNEYHAKLDKVLSRVNASDIKLNQRNNIEAKIYNFTYEFICEGGTENISYARNDGKYGIISSENIDFVNNILLPLMVYSPCVDEDKEVIKVDISDAAVRIHLLLPGDYFICYQRILCNYSVSHKTKFVCLVTGEI